MGIEVTLNVDRIERQRLSSTFKEISKRANNWRPFWPVVEAQMKRSITMNFRTGGRPRSWPALSGWTQKVRAGRGALAGAGSFSGGGSSFGQDVLNDQGTLLQSIGNVKDETRTTFRYGTNLIYARMMHFGTAGLPGGVLTPKKSKYLALPFPGITGRPRDYANTFVLGKRPNSKVMFQKLSGDGGVRPIFLLKKSVRIPARPFVMYQPEDVDKILTMASIYVVDPARFVAGPGA